MKEIDHTVEIDYEITVKEIGPTVGIDHYTIGYKRANYSAFQDHGNRRKYKDCYKDKYRDEKFYNRDRSYDRNDSYSRDRLQGYYREFKDQRHEIRSEDYYKDRYGKENHRNSDKNKNKYQKKDQHKNDSNGKSSGFKERDYLYDEDDIFHLEIERVYKILQRMGPEKEMAIGFILEFSVNPDKILDSIC